MGLSEKPGGKDGESEQGTKGDGGKVIKGRKWCLEAGKEMEETREEEKEREKEGTG